MLPVILFHAGFEMFSGGFVGVDVFFVISGYLITTIILAELEQGKFSIVNFYERRARRILPALFLVMLVCIPFAWHWLLPGDMRSFARSFIAVSIFLSNIQFYRESGYFDTAAEFKPLLHTWSLSVEEQYYVLFPLLLMLGWRFGKKWLLFLLAAVFVASLVAAEWLSIAKPAAAFFLLYTRGWELLIGAFAAFYLAKANRHEFGRGSSEFLGWLGLGLLLYSVFTYSKATPFPGLYALAPTVGSALIILFATQKTCVGKLVGHKYFVGVGLISYSAYLWHQPLFAFARHASSSEPGGLLFAVLSVLALVLAYFSWRYVESPFRNKSKFSRRQVFKFSLAGSVCFLAFGLIGNAKKGFEFRLDDTQREVNAFNYYDIKDTYREGNCFLEKEQSYKDFKAECAAPDDRKAILIWGDSHAAAMSYGFRKNFPAIAQFTATGCPPLLGVAGSRGLMCEGINNYVAAEVAKSQPHTVVLHANWSSYGEQKPLVNLEKTIGYIRTHSPRSKIVVIGSVPQYSPSLPSYMLEKGLSLTDDVRLESYAYENLANMDKQLELLGKRHQFAFFSALSAFCAGKQCLATTRDDNVLMPTAWDYGHLTAAGSVFLANRFKEFYDPKQ